MEFTKFYKVYPSTPPLESTQSVFSCATIALTFTVRSLDSTGGRGGINFFKVKKIRDYIFSRCRQIDDFSKSAKREVAKLQNPKSIEKGIIIPFSIDLEFCNFATSLFSLFEKMGLTYVVTRSMG